LLGIFTFKYPQRIIEPGVSVAQLDELIRYAYGDDCESSGIKIILAFCMAFDSRKILFQILKALEFIEKVIAWICIKQTFVN